MFNDLGLLILRVGIGLMMLLGHGQSKLFNFNTIKSTFPDPLGIGREITAGLAIFSEFFCALLIVVGLFTRFACFPLFFTMLVAVFVVHAGDPWAKQELGMLYALPLFALMFTGGGRFALENILLSKKAKS